MRMQSLTILLAISLTTACSTAPSLERPYALDSGWQLYPAPRSGGGPGTIFSIDKNKAMHLEAMLSFDRPQSSEKEILPSVSTERNWKAGLVLTYLGVPPASLSASISNRMKFKVAFEGVQRHSRKFQDEVAPALRKVDIKFQPGYRYFVVEEVRSATAADISYESSSSTALSLSAILSATFQLTPSTDQSRGNIVTLTKSFGSSRLNVMYIARELTPTGTGAGAGTNFTVSSTPVIEPLEWESE